MIGALFAETILPTWRIIGLLAVDGIIRNDSSDTVSTCAIYRISAVVFITGAIAAAIRLRVLKPGRHITNLRAAAREAGAATEVLAGRGGDGEGEGEVTADEQDGEDGREGSGDVLHRGRVVEGGYGCGGCYL